MQLKYQKSLVRMHRRWNVVFLWLRCSQRVYVFPIAGTASFLLRPTRFAAPLTTEYYAVSGLLTYYSRGQLVSINLYPDTIQVVPVSFGFVMFCSHHCICTGQICC